MKNHKTEVLNLLASQIADPEEVEEIGRTAAEVARHWVDPLKGGKAEEINGLIYGLIQSGKTGVLTVSGALGADQGYRSIVILTSDIDPLYDQTLGRIRESFPGMDVIEKKDIKDPESFLQRIRTGTCAIVVTKNSRLLGAIIENLKKGNVRGLSCLIIDDEADQASLNTKASKADGSRSAINDRIAELREFFDKNTYLQVTATPQALFLQAPGHDFRPRFTVLSHPGAGYVGGDEFFGDASQLVREFDLQDIDILAPGPQPSEDPRCVRRPV